MNQLILARFGFKAIFARAGARQNGDPPLAVKLAQLFNFVLRARRLAGLFGGLARDYGSEPSFRRRTQGRIYESEQRGLSRCARLRASAQSGDRAERGQRRRVRDGIVLDQVAIILGSQRLERQIPRHRVGSDDQMLPRDELLLGRFERQVIKFARLSLGVRAASGNRFLKLRYAGVEVVAIRAQDVDFQRGDRLSRACASAGFRKREEVDALLRLHEIEQRRLRISQQSRRTGGVERFALAAKSLQLRAKREESVAEPGVIFLSLTQLIHQINESIGVRFLALPFALNLRVERGYVGQEFSFLLALAQRHSFVDPHLRALQYASQHARFGALGVIESLITFALTDGHVNHPLIRGESALVKSRLYAAALLRAQRFNRRDGLHESLSREVQLF